MSRIKNKIEPDSSIRFENITRIGIDETSYHKGHKYVTVVLDHDSNQVIWVDCGTGVSVLDSFFSLLTEEQKAQIKLVSADGAKWIKSSIKSWLPHAEHCIDAFHVVSHKVHKETTVIWLTVAFDCLYSIVTLLALAPMPINQTHQYYCR